MKQITVAARKANGKSRMCKTCKFAKNMNSDVCLICSQAFKDGYTKGYQKAKKIIKND